jgi:hypothetical protein
MVLLNAIAKLCPFLDKMLAAKQKSSKNID